MLPERKEAKDVAVSYKYLICRTVVGRAFVSSRSVEVFSERRF